MRRYGNAPTWEWALVASRGTLAGWPSSQTRTPPVGKRKKAREGSAHDAQPDNIRPVRSRVNEMECTAARACERLRSHPQPWPTCMCQHLSPVTSFGTIVRSSPSHRTCAPTARSACHTRPARPGPQRRRISAKPTSRKASAAVPHTRRGRSAACHAPHRAGGRHAGHTRLVGLPLGGSESIGLPTLGKSWGAPSATPARGSASRRPGKAGVSASVAAERSRT